MMTPEVDAALNVAGVGLSIVGMVLAVGAGYMARGVADTVANTVTSISSTVYGRAAGDDDPAAQDPLGLGREAFAISEDLVILLPSAENLANQPPLTAAEIEDLAFVTESVFLRLREFLVRHRCFFGELDAVNCMSRNYMTDFLHGYDVPTRLPPNDERANLSRRMRMRQFTWLVRSLGVEQFVPVGQLQVTLPRWSCRWWVMVLFYCIYMLPVLPVLLPLLAVEGLILLPLSTLLDLLGRAFCFPCRLVDEMISLVFSCFNETADDDYSCLYFFECSDELLLRSTRYINKRVRQYVLRHDLDPHRAQHVQRVERVAVRSFMMQQYAAGNDAA
jgi:hypothetical protein